MNENKKQYEEPTLLYFGTVEDLTQQGIDPCHWHDASFCHIH
jgi:hypothetical protein